MQIILKDLKNNRMIVIVNDEDELNSIDNIKSFTKVSHDFRNHTDTYELILGDD